MARKPQTQAPAQTATPAAPAQATPAAPAQAPAPVVLQMGGSAYTLPKTVGAIATAKAHKPATVALLQAGKPYSSRGGHNAAAWHACQLLLAQGPQTGTALAAAIGPIGTRWVAYACKSGWLVPAPQA